MSLKFDEESEFYRNFIKEKQNNLELSSFIIEILEAYYYSEDAREHIDNYIKEQNPHYKIYEEISRIALEYNKHATSINMMGDFNTNAKEEYNKNKKQRKQQETSKEMSELEELQELERLTKKFGLEVEGNKIKKNNKIENLSEEIIEEEIIEEKPIINDKEKNKIKTDVGKDKIVEENIETVEEESEIFLEESEKDKDKDKDKDKVKSSNAMSKLMGSLNV